jgi:integrase
LAHGELNVERGIVNQIVDDVKTDGSRRLMTVDHELIAILETWRQNSQFQADWDWIFASPLRLGRLPYGYTGFWRELRRAGADSGIGPLGTHAFRHTHHGLKFTPSILFPFISTARKRESPPFLHGLPFVARKANRSELPVSMRI